MVTHKFGTPLNSQVPQEPKAYKGQVPRGEEPCGPHTGWDCKDQYTDTFVRDEHNSEFERKTWSPDPKKGSHWELVDGNGNGFIRGPDSSCLTMVNGTDNKHGKNGGMCTYNSNMDSATYGGSRQVTGNDGNQKHLAGRPPGGATYTEDMGYTAAYAAMHTSATSAASGRGDYHIGKRTINAEGGIGLGVSKGSAMKIFQRMEPDGTYHLQVTPQGEEGGNAIVKINPDGTIEVTSEKSCSFKIKGDMKIEAKSLDIQAPTSINGMGDTALNVTGNMVQAGSITSSGAHKAKAHV